MLRTVHSSQVTSYLQSIIITTILEKCLLFVFYKRLCTCEKILVVMFVYYFFCSSSVLEYYFLLPLNEGGRVSERRIRSLCLLTESEKVDKVVHKRKDKNLISDMEK